MLTFLYGCWEFQTQVLKFANSLNPLWAELSPQALISFPDYRFQ